MSAVFLSTEEITRNIRWLSEQASPPVKYLTDLHLKQVDLDSKQMRERWKEVEHSQSAEEIFSRQFTDGSWFSSGPWGARGYRQKTGRGYTLSRPKFVTTAWILPYLGEMGFTAADERIQKACDFMLAELAEQHLPAAISQSEMNTCGLSAIPLRAFASVGMLADERIQDRLQFLLRCQREDGGWLNPNHLADSPTPSTTSGRWPWDRSCVWGTFYAAQALYYVNQAASQPALAAANQFLLSHLSKQVPHNIQTWVFHGHNIVRELLMFSELGFEMDAEPGQSLLQWLKGFYQPEEGVFRTVDKPVSNFTRHVSTIIKNYEARYGGDYWKDISKTGANVLRYHLYHLIEEEWLTYYLTRIAININA